MPKKDPEQPKFYYGKVSFEQIMPHLRALVRQGRIREAKEFEEAIMFQIKKAETMILTFRRALKHKYEAEGLITKKKRRSKQAANADLN